MFVGGIAASSSAVEQDAMGNDVVTKPGLRAAGITMLVVGAIGFYGGYTAGAVLLGAAGIKRRNTRLEAGVAFEPGGLTLRF